MPISAADIAEETRKDAVLSKELQYTLTGWPNCMEDDNLTPFFQRREDITTEAGVLQWGLRVVIPQKFRNRILYELHEGHIRMNKTKAMARSYVYWPKIDLDIEKMVKDCHRCAEGKNMPAPLRYSHGHFRQNHGNGFLWILRSTRVRNISC